MDETKQGPAPRPEVVRHIKEKMLRLLASLPVRPNRELLFKVIMGVGGREYLIYDNGEIEGFGAGALIFNYHPQLVAMAVAQAKGTSAMSEPPTTILVSDLSGASQTSPR